MLTPFKTDSRRQALRRITTQIHHMIPRRALKTDRVGGYKLRHGFLNNEKIKRLIIYMRSSGCQWMLDDDKGGCFMCGHLAGTTQGKPISEENYIDQFENITREIDFADIPMLCVYNAGSFFNDREVPAKARHGIYKRINKIDGIRHIVFESRPEYIRAGELQLIRDTIDKHIEIGIGFESATEKIRQVCLNKGFTLDEYLRAVDTCKEHGVSCLAYLLLKPPFLTEQAAVNDAVTSIKWAFDKGVDVVSIEPVSVQKGTLVHLLYNMGLYRPPWIWSVLNVVKASHTGNNLIRIGGFEFFPPPSVCVHNCASCNGFFVDEIERYNATHDISSIHSLADLECEICKDKWREEMKDTTTMEENMDRFLAAYGEKDLERYLKGGANDLIL